MRRMFHFAGFPDEDFLSHIEVRATEFFLLFLSRLLWLGRQMKKVNKL